MNIEQLMREHDYIDRLTLALEDCCAAPTADVDAVIGARAKLREVLEDHLAHEDEAIYPQLMAAGGRSAEALAHFDATFAQLRADWSDYLTDWDGECLAVDWETFQFETAQLMARVRDRTTHETALLYPLALQNGSITLSAA